MLSNDALKQNTPVYLSQQDVDFLLNDNSSDSRINVLEKISRQYTEGVFRQQELLYAEQIFRVLMRDTELRVRETLSQRLHDNPTIPRDIILHMAHDVEQVAIPVLEASQVLSDADLIHIIETSRELSKLIAVSKRESISGRVSDQLVETMYPQVVKSLLHNAGATITEPLYDKIIKEFAREDDITAAMVHRIGLPLSVAEKLVKHVSGALADELYRLYKVPTRQAAEEAHEAVTLNLMTYKQSDEELEKTITHMIAFDRLTPSIILSSLCRGYLNFFEISLAKLAHIPKANARKLIHDKGPLGFKALYDKTGLPESMFEAVRIVLQVVETMDKEGKKPASSVYINDLVERTLHLAQGKDIENLPYLIALIRQSSHH